MTPAPSIKEALELKPCPFCGSRKVILSHRWDYGFNRRYPYCEGCFARGPSFNEEEEARAWWNTRATFHPDGEGREAIARLATRFWSIHPKEIQDMGLTREQFYVREMTNLLASGLVQNEAGWRPISTAPRDGTLVDVWSEDYGRLTDARYLLSEYTDGVPWGWSSPWRGRITDATNWKPLPAPPIRSARNGDAS